MRDPELAASIATVRVAQRMIDAAEHSVWNADAYFGRQCAPGAAADAAALATVLDYLIEVGDIDGLRIAIEAHDRVLEEQGGREKRRQELDRAAYAEAERRHALAVKAACPYCGSQPGSTCRTSGGSTRGVHDHIDRYRAATSARWTPTRSALAP